MNWLQSLFAPLCLRPCCKLGNSAFWERVLFGRIAGTQVRLHEMLIPRVAGYHSGCGSNAELIEIRTRDASAERRGRARIVALVVKPVDPLRGGDDAPEKTSVTVTTRIFERKLRPIWSMFKRERTKQTGSTI